MKILSSIGLVLVWMFTNTCAYTTTPKVCCSTCDSVGRCLLGVNRTELYQVEGISNQLNILDSIKASGCQSVRITISRTIDLDLVKTHILYCNHIGLRVMLLIKLGGIKEFYPSTAVKRKNEGIFYNVYSHSNIDESLYNFWIRNMFSKYKKAGCVIDVVEVGNEIGWCDFNADLPIMMPGKGFVFDDSYTWNNLPKKIKEGICKVGLLAKITSQALTQLYKKESSKPKVIIGGLNYFHDTRWMIKKGGTIIRPDLVLKILNGTFPGQPSSENYLLWTDGISLHMYPSDRCPYRENYVQMCSDAINYINEWMKYVIKETDKPFYLSEFGYRLSTYGENQDYKRKKQFEAFMEAINQTWNKYKWAQVHIFSWDQGMYPITKNGVALNTAQEIFKRRNL